MPKPRYEALTDSSNHIRLLRFRRSDDPSCLTASSTHHKLEPSLAFIALSYEWGEQEPLLDLRLNGTVIQIRHNLWTFLQVIVAKIKARKIPADSLFWVDAICIDQKDVVEKNAQVALMGTIYSSAAMVFAWLGSSATNHSDTVFDFLVSTAQTHRATSKNSNIVRDVLAIFRCRYWTRRWILQELFLPRRVIIFSGYAELGFDDLLRFTNIFVRNDTSNEFTHLRQSVLFKMIGLAQLRREEFPSLSRLLVDFSDLECESKLDRVYSLRSLVKDGSGITIDYDSTPEMLVCRVLMADGWDSAASVKFLARDLGTGDNSPLSQQLRAWDSLSDKTTTMPEPIIFMEPLSLLSRISCIVPVDLDEVFQRAMDWVGYNEPMGIPLVTPPLVQISTLVWKFLEAEAQCSTTRACDPMDFILEQFASGLPRNTDEGMISFKARLAACLINLPANQWIRHRNAKGGWVAICDDGSVGVVCEGARTGDLVCRTQLGHIFVLREHDTSQSQLVGTARICWEKPSVNSCSTVCACEVLGDLTGPVKSKCPGGSSCAVERTIAKSRPEGRETSIRTPRLIKARLDIWELLLLTAHKPEQQRLYFIRGHLESLFIPKSINDWPKPGDGTPAYWYRPSRWSAVVSRLDELFVPTDAIDVFSKGEPAFRRRGDLDVHLYRLRTRNDVIVINHGTPTPDGWGRNSSLLDGEKWK